MRATDVARNIKAQDAGAFELCSLGRIRSHREAAEAAHLPHTASLLEFSADEVARSNPDVIYVVGPGAIIYKKLNSSIPVVTLTANPVVRALLRV
jgi:putative ABC transport system substrate-binding protein